MDIIKSILKLFGIRKFMSIKYFGFIYGFMKFRRISSKSERFSIFWQDRYPCLNDKTESTGFDSHYVYHTAWAARILAKLKPENHIDISSSLYFISLVSAFIPIKFYDYRPADLKLSNLFTGSADLLALPFEDKSVKSLSCMHVVEHIGLGRYGDALDPNGDLKAISELKRVLSQGGSLLLVVPVGKPKIMFNAHRIYSYAQIVDYFSKFELKEFALISDEDYFIEHATKEQVDLQKYGCGCFWFIRSL